MKLTFAATGDELACQWIHDGQIVSGATDTVLAVDSFQASDAGTCVARATNRAGVAQTLPATLTLVRAPAIQRMRYEAGEASIITITRNLTGLRQRGFGPKSVSLPEKQFTTKSLLQS